jgi:DNA-binding XRE family transcriptional regulator
MLYLEKGKYNPSLFLAYKVAKSLHSTIEEVFIIEDDGTSSPDGDALNLE